MNPQDPIHRWKVAIRRRWDPPASVALQNFMSTRYTLSMAMSGTSMIQYFSTKIRLAKEAGLDNVYQQLLAVWNGLDVDIREHIPEPDEDTTMEKFRRSLEERERLWKEKLLRNRVRLPGYGPYGARGTGGVVSAPGQDSAIRSGERPWMSPAPNQGGPRYAGNNPTWRGRNDCQGRIAQPHQRLQIASGPTTGPAGVTAPGRGPPMKKEPQSSWTPGRRACAKCGGQHMDWEHDYYQNPANANRRPPKAFYLDVLQHGMDSYSREDVADCISAYHGADEEMSSPATVTEEFNDVQAVGGSNWFASDNSRSYTDYDSEMEYVAQYHYLTNPPMGIQLGEEKRAQRDGSRTVLPPRDPSETSRNQVTWDVPPPDFVDELAPSELAHTNRGPVTIGMTECPLGEEKRVQRDGSRTVLPPRDLSETSRTWVTRDVPSPDYIDGLAMQCDPKVTTSDPLGVAPVKTPDDRWVYKHAECQISFPTRNKLFRHLREQAHFVGPTIPSYQTSSGSMLPIIKPSRKPQVGTGYAFRGYKFAEVRV
jgi:hypothetical protein